MVTGRNLGPNVLDMDEGWFRLHPKRQYRMRPATQSETEVSGLKAVVGVSALTAIVRRTDHDVRLFLASIHVRFADEDEKLADVFRRLGPTS